MSYGTTIITNKNFRASIDQIAKAKVISCDTETTGLKAYLNDQLFSIVICTKTRGYYFNFNDEDAIFLSKYCELIPRKTGVGFLKKTKQILQRLRIPIPKNSANK